MSPAHQPSSVSRPLLALVTSLALLTTGSGLSWARRAPWRPGETFTYRSGDGRHAVRIVWVKNPNTGPCRAVLLAGKKEVWRRTWPSTPGAVTIADDLRYLCALNFSNYDEHWFRSVSIYDKDGQLLKELTLDKDEQPRSCRLEKNAAVIGYYDLKERRPASATYSLPEGKRVPGKTT